MDRPNPHTFFISPTTPEEECNITIGLSNTKVCSSDNITMAMFKHAVTVLCYLLSLFINKSFINGEVRDKIKIDKILLFPNVGSSNNINNWQPISILCVSSKLFEKLMLILLLKFINKYNLLFTNQHGFRAPYLTATAKMNFTDNIIKNIDNGSYTVDLFIEICKAFDSLSHEILLNKLYNYGFKGNSLSWLTDYLSHRYQYIHHKMLTSNLYLIKTGVPQGSILGLILFLIYINDLPNSAPLAKFCLCADDTAIIISHNSIVQFLNNCSHAFKYISYFKYIS